LVITKPNDDKHLVSQSPVRSGGLLTCLLTRIEHNGLTRNNFTVRLIWKIQVWLSMLNASLSFCL